MAREKVSNRIIPTAWMVAYQRTFSNIPYSKEIYQELQLRNKKKELSTELTNPKLAPQYEARYKLVNRLLRECGIAQIYELASGLSPRPLELSMDQSITYVELDLPDLMEVKRTITQKILARAGQTIKPNLFQEEGDVLNADDFNHAARHFNNGPIAVVNEGLMRYLSMDEKASLALSILALLKQHSGAWITPDITLRAVMDREDEIAPGKRETIQRITGMDFTANQFENVNNAREFFENIGFTVQQHPFTEVIRELSSPKGLEIPPSEVQQTLNHAQVFFMRPTRQ